jgi:threonyl-tRNA synthetase
MISIHIEPHGPLSLPPESTGLDVLENLQQKISSPDDIILCNLNGTIYDLSAPLPEDGNLSFIKRDSNEALPFLRHDCAHVLAEAVQTLYPETLVAFGPAINNGFYYDFHRETPFTPDDLPKIEAKMLEIIQKNHTFERINISREKAHELFSKKGEIFKAEHVLSLPENENLTLYRQGEWIDLCRGPHAPSTKYIGKAFALTHVSGAYWKGDARNPQLQRIYGTSWHNQKDLRLHLQRLEDAARRDHRKIGPQMDLFHLQDDAPGSVFWHPPGWQLYRTLENYIRMRISQADYKEVKTPQLLDRHLWEKSGHWEKYRDNMFLLEHKEDKRSMALKPMNCPCHVEIFKKNTISYRDLPLRMSEFGSCHRNEPAGALHGIMRVRAFTQDDAHIFCTEDHIAQETSLFCNLLLSIYKDLGFEDIKIVFADRPEVRAGDDAIWDKAEHALHNAIKKTGIPYSLDPGEGAFYGPKLDFVLRDSLAREWQCGTFQADFVLPKRLGAHYIGTDGQKHTPVMLHRAILGSFERFIGILIEHYEGKFPLWLAPEPLAIATITNEFDDYALEIYQNMKSLGFPIVLDTRPEKINYKIRNLSMRKIPFIWIVGQKEKNEQTVTIRRLGQKQQTTLSREDAKIQIINERKMPSSPE